MKTKLVVASAVVAIVAAVGSPAHGLLGLGGSYWNWTLGGQKTHLLEVPVATPIGLPTSTDRVQPGAIVQSDAGQCTFNFMFTGSDGRNYAGTAGHCILSGAGEQSWSLGDGPEARDGDDQRIGEFAYAVLEDPKDFALIRLDAGVPVNPQMVHFGGPTGTNNDLTDATVTMHHYGNGIVTGQTVAARSALAFGLPDPDHVYAQGLAAPGDSGSGIISADGRAVGVIVTIGVHSQSIGFPVIDAGVVGITRLGPQVARATAVTGVSYTLRTAPQL